MDRVDAQNPPDRAERRDGRKDEDDGTGLEQLSGTQTRAETRVARTERRDGECGTHDDSAEYHEHDLDEQRPRSAPPPIPIARNKVRAPAFWTVRIKKKRPATTTTTKKHRNTTVPRDSLTLATPGDSFTAWERVNASTPGTERLMASRTPAELDPGATATATADGQTLVALGLASRRAPT